jgi:Flp pilus assembly protein TadD
LVRAKSFLLVVSSITTVLAGCQSFDSYSEEAASFVGRETCAGCHAAQDSLWRGSHHDLAMQVADSTTVLGDFDDASFTNYGVTSTFATRDGKYFVRTDGPDGELVEYEVAYVFGVVPLQQYLIEFPGGSYQALGIAWDARPEGEGGQRWYHLYPDEKIDHQDELHWTGLNQNWNYMCAECHSTDLRKNYDAENDRYDTTWAEIDVACESCHGPGSRHVAWAESDEEEGDTGLVIEFHDRRGVEWVPDMTTGIMSRVPIPTERTEVDACARCHSRRAVIRDEYEYGQPLMETHLPVVLEEGLYHDDGQILDEVYVYGSFLQSTMYGAGVTCSDCHEPHSLAVRAPGNQLCARCHLPAKFDTPEHHFHPIESSGASCVECHMPSQNYMVVDPRRDHSMRVPRPDLTVKLGAPNACTACHTDRDAAWVVEAVEGWYGPRRSTVPHYGEVFRAARAGRPEAGPALVQIADDDTAPNIVRATALSLLRPYAGPGAAPTIQRNLGDGDPMVRAAAVSALELVGPDVRLDMAHLALRDPVFGVRIVAARILASVSKDLFSPEQREAFEKAKGEYIAAQLVNGERPESHVNIGLLYAFTEEFERSEASLRTAIAIDPRFVPTYVNLADLYRLQGRDDEGETLLREALARSPENAEVHHSLGLLLVRQNNQEEAIEELERAAELRPEQPRYSYVLAVALHSAGETGRALVTLEAARRLHPSDPELLAGLATLNRELGSQAKAIRYAEELVELWPGDPNARALLEEIRRGSAGD